MIAGLSTWFSEHSGVPQRIVRMWCKIKSLPYKPYTIRLKPFDCPLCLAWWSALIWFWFHPITPDHAIASPVFAGFTSLLAIWLSKKLAP